MRSVFAYFPWANREQPHQFLTIAMPLTFTVIARSVVVPSQAFRASHAMLRRPTAVKLLRPDLAGEDALQRFEREVQLTSQLTHPNTIAIYDYGRTPDGTFYYAMEFLDGMHLETLVSRHGPQGAPRVIHILSQVCGSLAEAHEHGLIHRDIKPANIILCERGNQHDVAKVVDFGLVKNIEAPDDIAISAATTITGTPLFMSPETIKSPDRVDGRNDLYSVGAVGYYLLTGKQLSSAKTLWRFVATI
jgi:serine/threonine-protein kinase